MEKDFRGETLCMRVLSWLVLTVTMAKASMLACSCDPQTALKALPEVPCTGTVSSVPLLLSDCFWGRNAHSLSEAFSIYLRRQDQDSPTHTFPPQPITKETSWFLFSHCFLFPLLSLISSSSLGLLDSLLTTLISSRAKRIAHLLNHTKVYRTTAVHR